jgi:hypothetical protein
MSSLLVGDLLSFISTAVLKLTFYIFLQAFGSWDFSSSWYHLAAFFLRLPGFGRLFCQPLTSEFGWWGLKGSIKTKRQEDQRPFSSKLSDTAY